MALGSVSISGMSQKEKERLMYMDGKLVWSSESPFNVTAPGNVDYIVVKNVVPCTSENPSQNIPTEIRIAKGYKGRIGLYQQTNNSINSAWSWDIATITFGTDCKISTSYPGYNYRGGLTIEGYQYI